MEKKFLQEPIYADELLQIFRSGLDKQELIERLSDYHEGDIADVCGQIISHDPVPPCSFDSFMMDKGCFLCSIHSRHVVDTIIA